MNLYALNVVQFVHARHKKKMPEQEEIKWNGLYCIEMEWNGSERLLKLYTLLWF